MSLVDQWLEWLEVDRARSKNTISTYARTLRTVPDPATATREDIEAWWRERAATLSIASRNNELSALRQFYRWCQRFEHREDDPTARLDALKLPGRVSRFVGTADLKRLLSTLPDDLRRAVALGAYSGIRVSEAAALHWRDIDSDSRRMVVRGKGDKERRVGISVTLLDQLLPDVGGNVVTGTDHEYSGHYLQNKVNAAIKGAGVDATFHKLRHRYGYKAAEAGIPITSIANAMGHSSTTTTAGYIAAVDSDLDRIAEAAVS